MKPKNLSATVLAMALAVPGIGQDVAPGHRIQLSKDPAVFTVLEIPAEGKGLVHRWNIDRPIGNQNPVTVTPADKLGKTKNWLNVGGGPNRDLVLVLFAGGAKSVTVRHYSIEASAATAAAFRSLDQTAIMELTDRGRAMRNNVWKPPTLSKGAKKISVHFAEPNPPSLMYRDYELKQPIPAGIREILLALNGVEAVEIGPGRVRVTLGAAFDWDEANLYIQYTLLNALA
ncbi:MAG: hypothetical protein ACHQ50_01565 [Fimbriimonadales bacterium]